VGVQQDATKLEVATSTGLRDAAESCLSSFTGDIPLLMADGSVLTSTDHHPMWDATTSTFTDAINVRVGEDLLGANGQLLAVTGERIYDQDLTAYNLQIDGIHTYYAGGTPVLVHNSCDPAELIYEANPKHGNVTRSGPRGDISRAPRGDCQAMLNCSIQVSARIREGVEPETGLKVVFRMHREWEGTEWWHGYVPGG